MGGMRWENGAGLFFHATLRCPRHNVANQPAGGSLTESWRRCQGVGSEGRKGLWFVEGEEVEDIEERKGGCERQGGPVRALHCLDFYSFQIVEILPLCLCLSSLVLLPP